MARKTHGPCDRASFRVEKWFGSIERSSRRLESDRRDKSGTEDGQAQAVRERDRAENPPRPIARPLVILGIPARASHDLPARRHGGVWLRPVGQLLSDRSAAARVGSSRPGSARSWATSSLFRGHSASRDWTSRCAFASVKTASGRGVASQRKTRLSMPPEASLNPSGLNATHITPAVWPRSVKTSCPVRGVPELDGAVVAGRGDPLAVGAENDVLRLRGMSLQGEGDRSACVAAAHFDVSRSLTSARSEPSGLSRLRARNRCFGFGGNAANRLAHGAG